ncbi:MAG: nitroreductase family protein [Candidatus Hermodarchaeota archaeon]|nr:nitroreductase family protein [Candidatus Hermodarchaeota archaeon]
MTEVKKKALTKGKSQPQGLSIPTNQLVDLIRMRRSIRRMTGERIPDEDLELILDAARYAPSPENMQMWRYVMIREDQEMKRIIADISQEAARYVFGNFPYEATQGRLWYMPDASRPGTYEEMRDGSLFRYPEKADAVIVCCASESWHDSTAMYSNELCGSVVVAMGVMNMWLVAHSMGYACAYQAVPFADKRHVEFICDKLGVPRTWTPLAAFCIGIPEKPRMLGPSRWPLEGSFYTERWGIPYIRLAFRNQNNTPKKPKR